MKKGHPLRGTIVVFAGIAIACVLSQVAALVQYQRALIDGEPDAANKLRMTLEILEDYVVGKPHTQSYDCDKAIDCSVIWSQADPVVQISHMGFSEGSVHSVKIR